MNDALEDEMYSQENNFINCCQCHRCLDGISNGQDYCFKIAYHIDENGNYHDDESQLMNGQTHEPMLYVKPLNSFKMLGSGISVIAGKTYEAIPASNQPDFERDGLIFITNAEGDSSDLGFLLDSTDYTEVIA